MSGDKNVPIVTIQEGQLRGTYGKNFDGDEFLQFFGIPYGKPPLKELRFKPPKPTERWEGVRDATRIDHDNLSIHRDELTNDVYGSEDCLYLNVYSRKLANPQTNLRPVMVYIHGGGLKVGSSRPGMYGPEFLMTKDIVLVTINYRLGILGFLAFDDPAVGVTGNIGFKDQNLALKWVQRNIAHFNGDPSNVTIFGQSAGGGSTHMHILSPASKGLFHKAIIHSGCTLNPWFWGSKNNARAIVKKMGVSASTEKEALEILQGTDAMEIFNAQEKLTETMYPAEKRYFGTVIETPTDDAFLTKSPVDIMTQGAYNKVPIIMGYTKTEGMLPDLEGVRAKNAGFDYPEFELEKIIPCQLNVEKGSTESKKICELLEKLYSKSSDGHHYDEFTDACFFIGLMETLRYLMKTASGPIYLYRMSLEGELNFLKRLLQSQDKPGVCHGDDLGYLFHMEITPQVKPGSLEERSIRTFVELWTNFAEYGHPTPNDKLNVAWKPVESENDIKLLDIGEKLVFRDIPERHRIDAWREILKEWPIACFE